MATVTQNIIERNKLLFLGKLEEMEKKDPAAFRNWEI
jgi:hypothetical protein